jgi:beta-lactamase class D
MITNKIIITLIKEMREYIKLLPKKSIYEQTSREKVKLVSQKEEETIEPFTYTSTFDLMLTLGKSENEALKKETFIKWH